MHPDGPVLQARPLIAASKQAFYGDLPGLGCWGGHILDCCSCSVDSETALTSLTRWHTTHCFHLMANHDEDIMLFTSLTGTDPSTADQYLSACNYNVEQVWKGSVAPPERQLPPQQGTLKELTTCRKLPEFLCFRSAFTPSARSDAQAFNLFQESTGSGSPTPFTPAAPSGAEAFGGAATADDVMASQVAADAAVSCIIPQANSRFRSTQTALPRCPPVPPSDIFCPSL